MNAVQDKYFSLLRLAKDQAGKPEGETAADIANRMREKYGESLEHLTADDLDLQTDGVRWTHNWERETLISIAHWLGYEATKRRQGSRGPWRKVIYVTAPAAILEEWKEAFKAHRGRIERIQSMAICGYLMGAFPSSIGGERDDDEETETPQWTAEEIAMMREAMRLGRKNRTRKSLNPSQEDSDKKEA